MANLFLGPLPVPPEAGGAVRWGGAGEGGVLWGGGGRPPPRRGVPARPQAKDLPAVSAAQIVKYFWDNKNNNIIYNDHKNNIFSHYYWIIIEIIAISFIYIYLFNILNIYFFTNKYIFVHPTPLYWLMFYAQYMRIFWQMICHSIDKESCHSLEETPPMLDIKHVSK